MQTWLHNFKIKPALWRSEVVLVTDKKVSSDTEHTIMINKQSVELSSNLSNLAHEKGALQTLTEKFRIVLAFIADALKF